MNEPTGKAFGPRRPWLALLLGLICPSLGQLYAGAPARAAVCLVALVVLLPLSVIIRVLLDFSPAAVVVGLLITLALALVIPVDALLTARRRRSAPVTRLNRWWIYVAYCLFVWFAFQPVLIWELDHFWFRTARIPSGSMMDTLLIGDYVILDHRKSRLTSIGRHELVVHKDVGEGETGRQYIKRVIGLPGETVELRDGRLYVDGRSIDEPYVNPAYLERDSKRDYGPERVKEDHFFVLGDHRNQSADSRYWGQLPRELIKGKVRSIWWSVEEHPSSFLPGTETLGHRLKAPFRVFMNTRWERMGTRPE